jgi:hypothetical protein
MKVDLRATSLWVFEVPPVDGNKSGQFDLRATVSLRDSRLPWLYSI